MLRELARDIGLFYAWSVGGGLVALVLIIIGRDVYDAARRRRRGRG